MHICIYRYIYIYRYTYIQMYSFTYNILYIYILPPPLTHTSRTRRPCHQLPCQSCPRHLQQDTRARTHTHTHTQTNIQTRAHTHTHTSHVHTTCTHHSLAHPLCPFHIVLSSGHARGSHSKGSGPAVVACPSAASRPCWKASTSARRSARQRSERHVVRCCRGRAGQLDGGDPRHGSIGSSRVSRPE